MKKILPCSLWNLIPVLFLLFLFHPSGISQNVWNGTADIMWYDNTQTEFNIYTAEELAGLAQLVHAGDNFAGKTVRLMSDIWLNADGDTTNNWPMIGGMGAGGPQSATEPYFGGIFKGNGHSIYNLFCDRRASAEAMGENRAGLFGTLRGTVTIDSLVLVRPKTRTGAAMCGTLVGSITGTQNSSSPSVVRIESCLVIDADVRSGANNAGGLAGSSFAQSATITSVIIRNCGVTGTVYSGGSWAGGIVATDQKSQIGNCYFAGHVSVNPATSGGNWAGICTPQSGASTTITNCYSNFTGSGTYVRNGTVKTNAEMQDESFINNITNTVDTIFKVDCDAQQNSGFPIMKWMSCGVPVTGITEICVNVPTTLTASGWDSYVWSTSDVGESITVSPNATTTYYVTGTSGSSSMTDSVIVNVAQQIQITTSVVPAADGLEHATITPDTYSQECNNTNPINFTIHADYGYYITRIVVNGETVESFETNQATNYVYILSNPQTTSVWNIVVTVSDKYAITTQTVLNDEDETPISVSGLVTPNNGNLIVVSYSDTTVYFHESSRYHIEDVIIDGISYGIIDSFRFEYITGDIEIKVIYYDDCGIRSFPFIETFPNVAAFTDCWERRATYSSLPSYSTAQSFSSPGALYLYSTNTTYSMVIMPRIDTPVHLLKVDFQLRPGLVSGIFEVGVLSHPDSAQSFVSIKTLELETANEWKPYTVYFNEYSGEGRYIAFRWIASSSAAYLDDITLDLIPECETVFNLGVTNVGYTSAQIIWDQSISFPESYKIEWEETGSDNWSADYIDGGQLNYVLSDLTPALAYTVKVTSVCSDVEGEASILNFGIPCITGDLSEEIAPALETTGATYIPFFTFYNRSYSQQIYLASELEEVEVISAIAFQYFNTTARTKDIEVYLGYTTDTVFASYSNFIPLSQLSLVYTRKATTFSNAETDNWVTLKLDYPFTYDGINNLVVAVFQRGTYDVAGQKFYTHNTQGKKSIYFYQDSDFGPANPTAAGNKGELTARTNIRFFECSTDNYSCIIPNMLLASDITINSAEITWIEEGESDSYLLEYREMGTTDWISEGVLTTTTHSLSNLTIATYYEIRVAALCDGGDTTAWRVATFATECEEITSIPYTENFDNYPTGVTYPTCWSRLRSGTNNLPYLGYWSSSEYITSPGCLDFNNPSNTGYNMAVMPKVAETIDISTLQLNFWAKPRNATIGTFIVGIMDDPAVASTFFPIDTVHPGGSTDWIDYEIVLSDYNDWGITGRYIAFMLKNSTQAYLLDNVELTVIPTCSRAENLIVSDLGYDHSEMSWTEMGTATNWFVEYGLSGFTPGSGIHSEITTSNPYTIPGLQPNTAYDFYVSAYCDASNISRSRMISFTTECAPYAIPFVENFDGNGTTFTPCWSKKSTYTTSNNPYITSTYYTSSPYSMYLYSSATTYSCLITPPLDADINALMLSFRARAGSTSAPIIVGAMSDPNDETTFTPIDTLRVSQANTWQHFTEILFENYTGSGKYIAFMHNYATALYIDNVSIDSIPSCWKPTQLSMINTTTQSVTIDWEINGGESEWVIEIGVPGFTPGIGDELQLMNVNTPPPFTINGLTTNTLYDIYIKAICAIDNSSDWTSKLSVATQCQAITVPYSENFNSYSPTSTSDRTVRPDCWSISCESGASTYPYIANWGAQYVYGGTGYSLDFDHPAGYALAVLPAIETTTPVNTLLLTFQGRMSNGTGGTFAVGVMDSPFDISTFTAIYTVPSTSTTFEEHSVDFSSYAGTGQYIAFRWSNAPSTSYYLDEVELDAYIIEEPCLIPTNLAVTDIDENSATVTWEAGGNETEWSVEYKKNSDSDYTTDPAITNRKNLINLAAETSYEVCVKAKCGDLYSERTCTTFTTLRNVITYTINASSIGNGTISPTGNVEVEEGENQLFEFRPDSAYKVGNVKIDDVVIEEALYPDNKYTFTDVRADATIQVTFVEDVGVNDYDLTKEITIFPNPTDNELNVKLEIPFETIEITNVLGQVIYKTTIHDLNFSINVSQYNPGVYFVKLAGENGTAVKKFVIN